MKRPWSECFPPFWPFWAYMITVSIITVAIATRYPHQMIWTPLIY